MDARDSMRAADADREAVAERLRSALNEGRLDLHEYDERLQRAYAAKTYADLAELLSDLPAPAPAQRSQLATTDPTSLDRPPAATPRQVTRAWLAQMWAPYVQVVATVIAIWAVISIMSTELLYFWPGWVAGPWGAVLLVRTVAGLAGGEPQREAARRERERQAKAARREQKRQRQAEERAIGPEPDSAA